MKMERRMVVVLLGLAACKGDSTDRGLENIPSCQLAETLTLDESKAYFPSKPGMSWFYRGERVSQFGLKVHERAITLVDDVMRDVNAFGDAVDRTRHVRVDDSGVWDLDGLPPIGPFHDIEFPIRMCSRFEPYHGTVDSNEVSAIVTMRGREDVTTQLGVFGNALRIERTETTLFKIPGDPTQYAAPHTWTEWYATGVGLVRTESNDSEESISESLMGFVRDDAAAGSLPRGLLVDGLAEGDSDETRPGRPAVSFDGDRFLVVVGKSADTSSSLVATLVNKDGAVEKTWPLTGTVWYAPQVTSTFDGTNHLVVFTANGVQALHVSPAGELVGNELTIAEHAQHPSVASASDGTSIVVYNGEQGIDARLVSATGAMSSELVVTNAFDAQQPTVASDGTDFFVAWRDRRDHPSDVDDSDVYGTRITAEGVVLDPAGIGIAARPVGETDVTIAFDGERYIVAWFEQRSTSLIGDGEVRAARVRPDGVVLDGPAKDGGFLLTESADTKGPPFASRFGDGTLIAWHVAQYNGYSGIYGARLDQNGGLRDGPLPESTLWLSGLPIGTDAGYSRLPVVANAGDRALVVWLDLGAVAPTKSLLTSIVRPW